MKRDSARTSAAHYWEVVQNYVLWLSIVVLKLGPDVNLVPLWFQQYLLLSCTLVETRVQAY
jgi:hypothetical protein